MYKTNIGDSILAPFTSQTWFVTYNQKNFNFSTFQDYYLDVNLLRFKGRINNAAFWGKRVGWTKTSELFNFKNKTKQIIMWYSAFLETKQKSQFDKISLEFLRYPWFLRPTWNSVSFPWFPWFLGLVATLSFEINWCYRSRIKKIVSSIMTCLWGQLPIWCMLN